MLDKKLLDNLVCPITKEKLIYDEIHNYLISYSAGLSFPIIDGIPILLPDKASKLDDKG